MRAALRGGARRPSARCSTIRLRAAPVAAPPSDFDVAAATRAATRAVVAARFPSLLDLVEEGM